MHDPARRVGSAPRTRSGYVALVGRPNAGKSTLMNGLVGERLSIVTAKAQTTWRRVTGILSTDRTQMIFLDTPGLLTASDLLQRSMLGTALQALREADVTLLLVDASRPLDTDEAKLVRTALEESAAPLLVAVNKVDVADAGDVRAAVRWATEELGGAPYPISARTGRGLDELQAALEAALPEGPFLYPPDELAAEPVRFFVAELVRETIFERLREEVPYSSVCVIEEFREAREPVYILAHVFVERNSQKRILIGEGGRTIREIGRSARAKIEAFLGRKVYLDLWVKVLPGWRAKGRHLKRLGFTVPDEHERKSRG